MVFKDQASIASVANASLQRAGVSTRSEIRRQMGTHRVLDPDGLRSDEGRSTLDRIASPSHRGPHPNRLHSSVPPGALGTMSPG